MRMNRTTNPRVPGNTSLRVKKDGIVRFTRRNTKLTGRLRFPATAIKEAWKGEGMSKRVLLVATAVAMIASVFGAASPALGAGDANEPICPNEALSGFRPYLSDCRAYERVSAVYKQGQPAAMQVSADGTRALEAGLGVHAGTESDYREAVYEIARGATGWTATAVAPPTSQFPAQALQATSSDLGKTLWILRTHSQSLYAQDLYVKQGAEPAVKIGAEVPPAGAAGPPAEEKNFFFFDVAYKYAGSSADLSHVLFQANADDFLWPGDETSSSGTNHESLYEYAGVGNTRPNLVGVDGAGHVISECGTTLGATENQEAYNAVSASGDTVFFTAAGANARSCSSAVARMPEVSELYARLDATESVSLSEPSQQQCAACNVAIEKPASEGGAEKPAAFAGASEDGSKAFFLSEQEMFVGDSTVNLYEYDLDASAGQKIVRVSTGSAAPRVLGVSRVSEDGSHVYFVAEGVLTTEPNSEGHTPTENMPNLYVFARDAANPAGTLTFVATLAPELDSSDWGVFDERPVQATHDGRFLVFQSNAPLVEGDPGGTPQIFEYDAVTGALVRVSVGQLGYGPGTANANVSGATIQAQPFQRGGAVRGATSVALSEDGSTVVFGSFGALTPDAVPASESFAQSVYEYRSTGAIADGDVSLVSDGVNELPAEARGIDQSGDNIFFSTADQLLGETGDSQFDNYDARRDGGFSIQTPAAKCSGEACLGSANSAPQFGVPSSVSVPGGGNLAPPNPPTGKPAAGHTSRATKLTKALKACRRKPRRARLKCERKARRAYGSARKASRPHSRGR
jgi:hypothetical protein